MSDKSELDQAQRLQQSFEAAGQTSVDEGAKALALRAAMAEFDRVQEKNSQSHQGFLSWLRPRGKFTTQRQVIMDIFQRKWLYSGMAAASVAVLAVMVTQQLQQPEFDSAQAPAKEAAKLRAELQASVPEPSSRLEEVVVTGSANRRDVNGPQTPPASELEQPRVGTIAHPERQQLTSEAVMDSGAVASDALRKMNEDDRQQMAVASLAQTRHAGASAEKIMESKQHSSQAMLASSAMAVAPMPQRLSPDAVPQPAYPDEGRDQFEHVEDNPVKLTAEAPVSTFSVDVDTASYSFVRRQLNRGVLPQKDAVRVEEMINYFGYDYPVPTEKSTPFSTNVVVSDSPWKAGNKLLHIGIKGYQMAAAQVPKTNLVFLLDVSGSMSSPDKLPLVKQSMELLLSQLKPDDTVAIAVYAGAAGTVLEPTAVKDKQKILAALNQLQAGGSTAGAEGIKLAYQLAAANFDKRAVNRVILATDGDFNVGITNSEELKGFVEREREKGIYLSVLGFGEGNYQDQLMQELAQNGNGVAAYIDTLSEAQKVLVTEATSSLFPIAQDVKIQVEFNPATVAEYRLLGYETRALAREDFNNDAVDAGDIGAGHTVTAIYELTPVGGNTLMDATRYGKKSEAASVSTGEYAFVKLRYKLPGEKESILVSQPVSAGNTVRDNVRVAAWVVRETAFATAVAGFAQLLRGGQYTGAWSYDDAIALAQANKGEDVYGYRTEFVQLIRKAKTASAL